jgi:hypothetical protein
MESRIETFVSTVTGESLKRSLRVRVVYERRFFWSNPAF